MALLLSLLFQPVYKSWKREKVREPEGDSREESSWLSLNDQPKKRKGKCWAMSTKDKRTGWWAHEELGSQILHWRSYELFVRVSPSIRLPLYPVPSWTSHGFIRSSPSKRRRAMAGSWGTGIGKTHAFLLDVPKLPQLQLAEISALGYPTFILANWKAALGTSCNQATPAVRLIFFSILWIALLEFVAKGQGGTELVISSKASFSSPRLWSLYSILWNTLSLLLFYYPHASRFRPSLGLDTLSIQFCTSREEWTVSRPGLNQLAWDSRLTFLLLLFAGQAFIQASTAKRKRMNGRPWERDSNNKRNVLDKGPWGPDHLSLIKFKCK